MPRWKSWDQHWQCQSIFGLRSRSLKRNNKKAERAEGRSRWVLMSTGEPSIINSFSDVLAAWSSWGRPAFCTAQCWYLQGAWWEVVPKPRRGWRHWCSCPFVQRLTPPGVVPQSSGSNGMGRWSVRALGTSSPLRQTAQDCGRTGHLSFWANFTFRRLHQSICELRQPWTISYFLNLQLKPIWFVTVCSFRWI